jgi:hypothetical protein
MTDTEPTLYCYVHPTRTTLLRCNNCERPICTSCAVRTPTGYRCRECVRGQQKLFDTAQWFDYVAGFVTAAVLGGISSLLVGLIGSMAGFFALILIAAGTSTAGMIIAEACRFVTRRHRSRPLFITITIGMIVGAIPVIISTLLTMNIFGLVFLAIYLFVAVPIVYSRLSGFQFFK